MHQSLLIREIAENVVSHLHGGDLARLARTSHAFTETALDALWEYSPEGVWNLARCMPEKLWTVEDVHTSRRGAAELTLVSFHRIPRTYAQASPYHPRYW
jgi:hypothetical protein